MNRSTGLVILFGLLFFLAFNLGWAMSGAADQKNRELPKSFSREPDFIKLKSLDDRAFILAGSSLQTCSNILSAASEGDVATIKREANSIDIYVDKAADLIKEREALLKKLGY